MKPLETIIKLLHENTAEVESWFKNEWQDLPPLPYFSCDIRHSIFKMGIVDTNLFPGGFNNLCKTYTLNTVASLVSYFKTNYPHAKNIALLAESHTRNKFYLLNVVKIKALLTQAGLNCRVTMVLPDSDQDYHRIELDDHEVLEIYRPQLSETNSYQLLLGPDFQADLILSNNDFSSGIPSPFEKLVHQIIPNPLLGWQNRLKSGHFKILCDITCRFAQSFSFDPWLICPLMETLSGVNENNFERLAEVIDIQIAAIQKKYDEYGITESPYVFVKNDSGTYGLGLISVTSGKEVLSLNRKKRGKLFSAKGESSTERFIIQEGIPTADQYSDFPIEPVIYGVGKEAIGGFFRIHESKNPYESLNAPGMTFSCLCLHKLDEPHEAPFLFCKSKEELIKGSFFLARLAALAIAHENRLVK